MALISPLLVGAALAQDYSFPTSAADYPEFYPTAYKDHGGVTDWNCGAITYSGHQGSDWGFGSFAGMDAGRDVYAAADGTVTATNDGEFDRCTTGDCYGGGGFGNYVYIVHPDGKTSIYAHLKSGSVAVSVGELVTCGTFLGEGGSSGYSTGPHLHFEVRNTSNVAEDPFDGPCSGPPTYWVGQGVYGELPDLLCEDPPECVPADRVTCGTHLSTSNDAAGSLQATYRYGCTDFVYSGPELVHTFVTDRDEDVSIDVNNNTGDLDLFVLGSVACDGSDCVTASTSPYASPEGVVFAATAGVEYTVVVDGWEGAVSAFDFDIACNGTFPGSTRLDTAPPDTGAGSGPTTPAGDDDDDDDDGSVPRADDSNPRVEPGEPKGCGCAAEGAGSAWLLLPLLALLPHRRPAPRAEADRRGSAPRAKPHPGSAPRVEPRRCSAPRAEPHPGSAPRAEPRRCSAPQAAPRRKKTR